jgi:hypothetical protein
MMLIRPVGRGISPCGGLSLTVENKLEPARAKKPSTALPFQGEAQTTAPNAVYKSQSSLKNVQITDESGARFQLGACLSREGLLADIYDGVDAQNRPIGKVVKLGKSWLRHDLLREEFAREAEIYRRAQQAGIQGLFGFYGAGETAEGLPFLVLEKCPPDAERLFDLMMRQALSKAQIDEIERIYLAKIGEIGQCVGSTPPDCHTKNVYVQRDASGRITRVIPFDFNWGDDQIAVDTLAFAARKLRNSIAQVLQLYRPR